jgi:DNA-binding Lrp family transcriptional regulator
VLHAFVLVHAQPNRVAALAEELAAIDGVAEVYSVTGPADIVAVVRVHEQEQLADVVTRHIACLDGIEATETMLAFQAFSKHDLDAMWSIGLE